MAVSFVDCTPGHLPALRAFFAEMYSPDYVLSADEQFLQWQFGPTPASGDPERCHLILGLVDEQIRGCIGYIPIELSINGRRRVAAWAANWMVDESTRRLGLGPLLMRELSKRFEVTLALGGNRDAHDLLPRMGWTDFGMLRRYVRILDPIAAAQLAGRDDVTFDAPEIRPLDTSASVTRVDAFGDDASELWNRTWGASAAGGQRSAEFLNWRYVSHPRFAHRLFELRRDGTLEGLAVSRLEQVKDSPLRVARLLELVADERHAPALLTAAADDAAGAGAAMIDFFIATARLDAALRSSGFVDGDQPPASFIPVLYQPIDRSRTGILFMANLRNAPDAAAISEWYVTKSDGDQDRPS